MNSHTKFRFSTRICCSIIFLLVVTLDANAQGIECHFDSYTLNSQTLSSTGFTLPKFNPNHGTLVGIRNEIDGDCEITHRGENILLSSGSVTPSTACMVTFDTYVIPGLGANLTNQALSITEIGSTVQIGPYDGIQDYGGSSGTTQQFGPLNYSSHKYFPTDPFLSAAYTATPGSTVVGNVAYLSPTTWNISGDTTFQNGFVKNYLRSHSVIFKFGYVYTTLSSSPPDCDNNGISDSCEIHMHGAVDFDQDGHPDNCPPPPDCNQNGIPDGQEISGSGALDCNGNQILDSCEIAADPNLDSEPDFANDAIPDTCQGRAIWEKPVSLTKGIKGAKITAYIITGSATTPIFQNLPPLAGASDYTSDSNGRFIVPKEYFATPLSPGELGRGIKATITYVDDTGIQTIRQITNYPGWDPLKPIRFNGFDRKILFPSPAVFQAGVLAKINGDSVNAIRGFLTLDAASTSAEGKIKRGTMVSGTSIYAQQPIPSFLFFAMPSATNVWTGLPSDGIPWGYFNNPLVATESEVAENSTRFQSFLTQKVKPQLDYITSGDNSTLVPVNILAHSYGGIITRKWMTEKYTYPSLNKYISFDGAHGGTATSNIWPGFFSEGSINGRALALFQPPLSKGWNYAHEVAVSPNYLMFSEVNESNFGVEVETIAPFTSAFGIGRIGFLLSPAPNGYCKRFIGGWELETFEGTHSIQNELPVAVSAARFLAYGSEPKLGTDQDPGAATSIAQFAAQASDPRYASAACFASSPPTPTFGTAYRLLSIPVSGQANFSFPVDQVPGSLHIEAYVSNSNATLNLYSGSVLLTKMNPVTIPFGNNDYLHSFDFNYTGPSAKTLRLASSEPAIASLTITFSNMRRASTETDALTYDAGAPVIVKGKMLGATNNTIIPSSGTINSRITAPDGSTSVLPLYDDGIHNDGSAHDGVYANIYSATSAPGFYRVFTYVDYNLQGWIAYRTERTTFEIKSTAASLDPTMIQHVVDTNNNSIPDAYAVNFTVNATTAGNYRLLADIKGSSGTLTTIDSIFSVTAGSSTQTLLIPLKTLYELPRGENLSLTEVRLVEPVKGQTLSINSDLALTIPNINSFEQLSPPIISSVLPNFGSISGGYKIVLKGENFVSTRRVLVGTSSASFKVIGDDTIQVAIPPISLGSTPSTGGSQGGSTSTSNTTGQNPAAVVGEKSENLINKEVKIKVVTAGGQVTLQKAFTYTN